MNDTETTTRTSNDVIQSWANIVRGKDEIWKNNMASSAMRKSKLRYVSPSEKDGKLVVYFESHKF